ncbi:MbnP family protein [Hymenobacter koreensis]|uniref:Copper-binding protein MbnP-like domain-containing protein n=1 Tax=Hymenobacter koreensis TaxID=1084523 RepID=A0ABP8JC07_9BACT
MMFPLFKNRFALLLAATLAGCGSAGTEPTPQPDGGLVVELQHVVGNVPLALHERFTTEAAEPFVLSRFDYYLSNLQLRRSDGSHYAQPESYHLIKESDPASMRLPLLDVPPGDYTHLVMTVGVDSARNVAGAQTGALDPLNGMFWTWNSGYIFLKAEGYAPQPGSTNLPFALHVGGFQGQDNSIRRVVLPLPGGSVQVRKGIESVLHVQADIRKLFAGPRPVVMTQVNTAASTQVADNVAAGMFRADDLHQR